MEKIIAHRKDHDCRENRLLDDITEYMNAKCERSGIISTFYNKTTKLIYDNSSTSGEYYTMYTSVFKKRGYNISIVVNDGCIYINKSEANEFFRMFKIKETVRNIQKQRCRRK
jgi:hypothetical protein